MDAADVSEEASDDHLVNLARDHVTQPTTEQRDKFAQEIAETFARQLKCSEFSVNEDFFAAGGASVIAALCVAELRRKGYPLALNDVFIERTPMAIAERVFTQEQQ